MFDYFRALDGLADEEREIHATVRAFVDEAIVPNVQGWWDGDTLPRELITQMGELGILGPTTPAEYGGSGISSTAYGLDLLRARARRLRRALVRERAGQPRHVPDLRVRLRGAEAPLPARAGLRRDRRLLRPDRVRRRQRPGRDAHARAARRRRLRAQRLQDVDHQQPAGRCRRGLGQGRRRRRPGLPRRVGCDRLQRPGHAQQGEPAREHHRRDRARGRARAGLGALPGRRAGSSTRSAVSPRRATASPGARSARSRHVSPHRSSTRRRARRSGARSPPASSSSRS